MLSDGKLLGCEVSIQHKKSWASCLAYAYFLTLTLIIVSTLATQQFITHSPTNKIDFHQCFHSTFTFVLKLSSIAYKSISTNTILTDIKKAQNSLYTVIELFRIWSGKRDSNSRPRPWQGRALPTELFPQNVEYYTDLFFCVNTFKQLTNLAWTLL